MQKQFSPSLRRRVLQSGTEALSVTTLLCAAGSLTAQTAGTKPATKTKTDEVPTNMEEIVIEATGQVYKPDRVQSPKYTQPLRDIPQTINVIPKTVMEERGAFSLRDVLRNVPGISMQAGEGGVPAGDSMSIRGFGARTDLFVDGIRDFGGYTRDPFNMEQVEVSKGPSSSNAGRGSTGGSVNMVSKTPHLEKTYQGDFGAGSSDFLRSTIDVNQPLSEHIALRLNLLYHDAKTAGRGPVGEERLGIAASLAFGLGTDTRLTLSYFHLDQDSVPDYGIPWVPLPSTTAGVVTTYTNGLGAHINEAPPVSFQSFYGILARDYEKTHTDVATVQFEHDINDKVKITNTIRAGSTVRDSVITAPRFTDVDAGPNITYDGTITRQLQSRDQTDTILADQVNLIAKFDTGALHHDVVAGFEVIHETSKNYARAVVGPATPNTNIFAPNPNDPFLGAVARTGAYTEAVSISAAAYFFDTISLGEHWQLTGGLRYDYFDTTYTSVTAAGASTELGRTDKMLSGRAALVYKPVEKGSIYLGYGTSFNPSAEGLTLATGATAANNLSVEPEQSNTVELGTKWDLFSEKLQLTAAVFRTDKTNARTEDPTNPGDVIVLDGQQRVQGVEFGFAGSITDEFRIFGGYTYLDSEVTKSKNLSEIGRPVSNTPEHSFSLWAVYDLPHGFQIGAGAQYVGSRYNGNLSTSREAHSYCLFDAMLGYKVNDNFSLRLNLYNFSDEEYIDRVGGGHFVPGAGRSAVITASIKF